MSEKKIKSIKNNKNEIYVVGLFFLLFSFVTMYFCTASSFRYAVNPWNDANSFFTVGKAMVNGKVPYRDIFEQKGPLLYLIHAISYLISKTSFTGVYILESISAMISTLFFYKISRLYTGICQSIIVSVVSFVFVVNSYCFYVGDSAEEFALPLITISLYYMLKYFLDPSQNALKWKDYMTAGVFTGCIAMIKFTLIGFWFAWMGMLMIHTLFSQKKIRNVFIFIASFFAGVIIAVIPWIIYFYVNGAIKDFINVYFVINATSYGNSNGVITKILDIIFLYKTRLFQHPFVIGVTVVGAIIPMIFKRFSNGKFLSRIAVPATYLSCVFFIFFGGTSYTYYLLPIMLFVIFVLILIMSFTNNITKNKSVKVLAWAVTLIIVTASVSGMGVFHCNSKFTERDIEKTYNRKISDYIKSHNYNGKILCYGTLDMGAYLLDNYCDVYRHFEKQNISYEYYSENIDSQNEYINTHTVDYVVTRSKDSDVESVYENNEKLRTDYNLVLSEDFYLIDQKYVKSTEKFTAYLFELKN